MKFIDEAKIQVIAGNGGDGSASFRREKNIPFGGPDGGDGGRGGSVIAVADRNINTLVEFRFKRIFKAQKGESGRGAQCYGKGGEDLIVRVPVGTVFTDLNSGEVVADLTEDGQTICLAKGGRAAWATCISKPAPTAHRASTRWRAGGGMGTGDGTEGAGRRRPAGHAQRGQVDFHPCRVGGPPKVADYPFTTLAPNLGVVRVDSERSFVIADIPGLIEGAAEGAGLGHQFLRHLQRTRLLLHLVDISPRWEEAGDPVYEARAIVEELRKYDQRLYEKPRWLVLNKIDMVDEAERAAVVEQFVKDYDWQGPVFAISALDGTGCTALTYAIMDHLATQAAVILEDEPEVALPAVDSPAAELPATDLPAAD